MRISDWSSDVCSSDLPLRRAHRQQFLCDAAAQMRGFQRARVDHEVGAILQRRQQLDLRRNPGRDARCLSERVPASRLLVTGRDRLLIGRSEEHTSELQSLLRTSYAVSCLKKKNT